MVHENIRLMIRIHNVTMEGMTTTFMSADMRASQPVAVYAHGVVCVTTWFGYALVDRYVYVVNFIEYVQAVNTRQEHVLVNVSQTFVDCKYGNIAAKIISCCVEIYNPTLIHIAGWIAGSWADRSRTIHGIWSDKEIARNSSDHVI